METARRDERLGGALILLLVYLFLEYVRPANPLGIPLVISLVLFAWWMNLKQKVWAPQFVCFYLLIAAIAAMGPFAVNNYAVWVGFQSMVAWLLCISIPMACFTDSLRKLRVLVNALIALQCYLGAFALVSSGRGPGGFVGDENDVALSILTFMPLAFFSILTARSARARTLLAAAVILMVAGVIATHSRGGFVGLVAVIGGCLLFSPRRGLGLAIGAALLLVGSAFVPDAYWAEMATIADEAEGAEGTGAHRMRMWGIAIDMFWANPLFGVGLNNYPFNVGHYMSAELLEKEGRSYMGTVAHSVYFTILSEIGAFGSLLVAAIVYYSVKSARGILAAARKMEGVPAPNAGHRAALLEIKGLAYGLLVGMIGYGVSGVFLTAFVYPHFWYVAALIVALAKLTERMAVDSEAQSRTLGKDSRAAPASKKQVHTMTLILLGLQKMLPMLRPRLRPRMRAGDSRRQSQSQVAI
jgi:putative inorganic carbon (hco3(-)) transporter